MRRAWVILFFLALIVSAGPKLYLKNRVIETGGSGKTGSAKRRRLVKTERAGRVHLLVQFDHAPGDDDVRLLRDRGAAVTGYVHENAFVVATNNPEALDDLDVRWMGAMESADKVSTLLQSAGTDGGPVAVLMEFHPDVDLSEARRIALDAGVTLADNPDLSVHHLLGRATASQIAALATRDEVAYIFPASDALMNGLPVTACASALTAHAAAGQYIPKVGDGWDGPGNNAATIGYHFSTLTAQLPGDAVQSEIVRAFHEWARYAQLTFTPASQPDAAHTINILFGRRAHGDPYPFDGPNGVLAHTFYPAPPNPEPLAGDMHFDDDETWRIGNNIDLFSVALHETGHALGLGHSDQPGAVMYPYYALVTGLTPDDIGAVLDLYAAQTAGTATPATPATPAKPAAPPLSLTVGTVAGSTTGDGVTVSGTATGGSGALAVTWKTDRGSSGAAQGTATWSARIPLVAGANTIGITVTDAQHSTVTRTLTVTRQPAATPVSIQITSSTGAGAASSTNPAVDLRGTASHPSGIQKVTWTCDRGGWGSATGTTAWDSGAIPLLSGANVITVTATAKDGSSASQKAQVMYTPPRRDTTAPTLTITSPTSSTVSTTAGSLVLHGTASDNVGVTLVNWVTAGGLSGAASGTTSWTTPAIPLIRGNNSITVRAFDAAGNVSWRAVAVTRK